MEVFPGATAVTTPSALTVAMRVSAEVKNTGGRSGEEVVQLYIREQGTSVARPVREMKGFRRIALAPGELKRVEFTIGRDELAFWNIAMKEVVEPARRRAEAEGVAFPDPLPLTSVRLWPRKAYTRPAASVRDAGSD